MHYAIVTETYPPEVNGVALTVHALAGGLQARAHTVSIVRPIQPDASDVHTDETLVPGFSLPGYAGLRAGFPCTRKLVRMWRDRRPDAVYIATEGPLGWSALRAARRLGVPAATGFHTRFDEYMRDYGLPWLKPVAMHWMRRFHNGAQATLVPTRELGGFLSRNGFRQVRLLERGVDTALFDPSRRDPALRASWHATDHAPVVVHVGRIAAEKNLALSIIAFRELQRHCPDARYVWIGDGPLRESIQAANPDFLFMGVQRGEALARSFASADLFVFPSTTETFGNVTLEAMASGVPTVAFDYGAAREHLRDGEHGAAITLGDDTRFIEAVVRIGRNATSRATMGREARKGVERLSPGRVAADFDALLAGLAGKETRHARLATA